ncbi:MAG TPA: energy transducer TonB [Solimonas sp.]|nr:energy transducer TonB [Solimonas sp.]
MLGIARYLLLLLLVFSGPGNGQAEPLENPARPNPAPVYPAESRRKQEEGTVMLRVRVDAEGRVAGLEVENSSGYERLDQAAVGAVLGWKFIPKRMDGQPIAGIAMVPIVFILDGSRLPPKPVSVQWPLQPRDIPEPGASWSREH